VMSNVSVPYLRLVIILSTRITIHTLRLLGDDMILLHVGPLPCNGSVDSDNTTAVAREQICGHFVPQQRENTQ
jgi:hypothetical protein